MKFYICWIKKGVRLRQDIAIWPNGHNTDYKVLCADLVLPGLFQYHRRKWTPLLLDKRGSPWGLRAGECPISLLWVLGSCLLRVSKEGLDCLRQNDAEVDVSFSAQTLWFLDLTHRSHTTSASLTQVGGMQILWTKPTRTYSKTLTIGINDKEIAYIGAFKWKTEWIPLSVVAIWQLYLAKSLLLDTLTK